MAEMSRRDFLRFAAAGALGAGLAVSGLGLSACGKGDEKKPKGPSGKATDTAQGKNGEVSVTVTVENGKITAVDIVGKNEIPNIGGAAMEEVADQIISAQSFEVDGVAGATKTSNAIKEAGQKAYDKIVG